MELKTMTSNDIDTDPKRVADIVTIELEQGPEILGYPGYYWLLPDSEETPSVLNTDTLALTFPETFHWGISNRPYSDPETGQNLLYGDQGTDLKDSVESSFEAPVSGRPSVNPNFHLLPKGTYEYLVWYSPTQDARETFLSPAEPPTAWLQLLAVWDNQFINPANNLSFTDLDETDPPSVEVEDPDVVFEIKDPGEKQEFALNSQGQATIDVEGTITINGQQAPEHRHRWDLDGVEEHIGPTGTIERVLAPGEHTVALRLEGTNLISEVTIHVVP